MRRDIKIEEIRALIALIDGGSLVNAAAIVGRTESALSLQLKRLEESTGVALLEKQGRRLVLTKAGRVVLEHGRKLIAAQEKLRDLAGPRKTCSQAAGEDAERHVRALPIDGMVLNTPMCVTFSPEGQFHGMRPVRSFRQSLNGPLLRAAYDYWMARCQRNEAVDFGAVSDLSKRCGVPYVVAVIGLVGGQQLEMSNLACNLGGGATSGDAKPGLMTRPCAKVMSLLGHVHKIEMPVAWSGACILESHQAHCAHLLALPLCQNGIGCDAVLLVSEVSLNERYHVPANAREKVMAPEMVQISTDDHVVPPGYRLKPVAVKRIAPVLQYAA